ncbi:SDR family NAD(P)-dependent oxidoreductase, partial [Streptomyces sp. NPDC054933]
MRTLETQGVSRFVEIGPNGALTAMIGDSLTTVGAVLVPALRKDRGEIWALAEAIGRLHASGAPVEWERFFSGTGARKVELPTYAFQRRRYWLEPSQTVGEVDPVEAEFWAAVEREDLDTVATTLVTESDEVRSSLDAVLPVLSSWRRRRRQNSALDSWRYRVVWKPLGTSSAARLSSRWLVVVPDGCERDAWVAGVVEGLGGSRVVVSGSESPEVISDRLRDALAEGPVAGVVSLLAVDERPLAKHEAVPAGLAGTVGLVQALNVVGCDARVWALTRGAVSVGRSESVAGPVQALVWGLGRVVALEHPDRWGGLVDLPQHVDETAIARLASVLAGSEDQVAVRASGVFGRRLVRSEPPAAVASGRSLQGTVLVTGGTGALGARVARWLAERGVEHLVLTSRRGDQAPGAAELVDELTALGSRVSVVACDVADRDAVADLLVRFAVTGVVHAAGALESTMLAESTLADINEVLAAKVLGAAHLDELL